LQKTGVLAELPSRVETDHRLKGTKKIIVRQGNVYVGKGRKDDRSILVIPVISDQPNRSNVIEFLLLLNIGFREDVALTNRIKALGGKYDHIRSIVQENNVVWKDSFLDLIEMDELFGRSAEKIGERIVSRAA
jgi:glucosamine--fructose-6-phosphate aminotransferase (isomerizing)